MDEERTRKIIEATRNIKPLSLDTKGNIILDNDLINSEREAYLTLAEKSEKLRTHYARSTAFALSKGY